MKYSAIILLFLLQVATSDGFLLAGTNSSNGNAGFLTVSEYYSDKAQAEHDLNQVRQDLVKYHDLQEKTMERNLNLLATQLQGKLDELERKLTEKTSIPSNIAELEKKYEEMSKKYEEMKNSSEMWQQKYEELENGHNQTTSQLLGRLANLETDNTKLKKDNADVRKELGQVQIKNDFLENKTSNLQQKVDGLEQLQTVNQLQTLHQLDQKSKDLENRMNSMENTQQARSQDFMALYRKVTSLETNEQKLETDMQRNLSSLEQNVQSNLSSVKQILENNMQRNLTSLEHNMNSNLTAMQQRLNTTINGLEQRTSTELEAVRASNNQSLSILEQHMEDQFKPVIFRATHLYSETVPAGIFKFPNIETTAGIPDSTITKYKSTGKFTCHDPGYYYIIVTTESATTYAYIDIMVNSTSKFQQRMTGYANNYTTPGAAAIILNLQTNDEVWIKTAGSSNFFRCSLNIFKIK